MLSLITSHLNNTTYTQKKILQCLPVHSIGVFGDYAFFIFAIVYGQLPKM